MKSFVAATMTKDEAKFSSRFTGPVPTSWQRRRREQNLAFCVSANRIRGLSGVAGKNRHDLVSRKPQGVVLTGGRLHVLNECGRGAQKAVQAPAGDFWKISTRVKRVDCRSASHRAANVPGMTGKADEVASVCSERDGEYDRPTDRRDFHPKHRSCSLGGLGRTLGGDSPSLFLSEPIKQTRTNMEPGIYYGLSNSDYHSSPGISKSGLDLIAKSPAHYYAKYLDPNRPPEDDEQTIAQLDGEIAHCAILEPDELSKRFAVGPDVRRNAKKWTEFEASLPSGVKAVKHQQYLAALRQAEGIKRIPDLANALSRGMPEVSAFWIDQDTGVLCKCRPDWVNDLGGNRRLLIDAKTCGDASLRDFSRMIAKHRYHVQDAYYRDGFAIASGCSVEGFVFAAVEMDYPHPASAIMLDEDSVEQGRREYRRLLDIYAECKSSGIWPAYEQTVQLARLPGWAFDQDEEIEIGFI